MVILMQYYETHNKIRSALSQAGIDVKDQEGGGFLVIIDLCTAFLGFKQDNRLLFFSRLVSHAVVSGKSEICIIADMGAFFAIDRMAEIASGRIRVGGFAHTVRENLINFQMGKKEAIFGLGYKNLFLQ